MTLRMLSRSTKLSAFRYLSNELRRYGDGEIVREGVVGDHGDGAFGTGRGGAANSR